MREKGIVGDIPTGTTEITVIGGGCYRVEGDPADVERMILNAARGSIMEFTWLIDAETSDRIGLNPEYVVMLRARSASGSERAE